jgi:hypothetical protein
LTQLFSKNFDLGVVSAWFFVITYINRNSIYSIRRENNIAQNSNRGTPHVEERQKEIA